MNSDRRAKLEGAGFRLRSAAELLGLSEEENELIELRLALSKGLRRRRMESGLQQRAVARKLGSSRSRVAKMESGDLSVSLDLLIRAMSSLGTSRAELGQIITANDASIQGEIASG